MKSTALILTAAIAGLPIPSQAALSSSCAGPSLAELPAVYSVSQGEGINEFKLQIFLDESSPEASQVMSSVPYMGLMSEELASSCGYSVVEFYSVPFSNGQPQPVDNFVSRAFTVSNGQVQQICGGNHDCQ